MGKQKKWMRWKKDLQFQSLLVPFDFLSSANGMNSIILTQVWQWTGWAVVIYLANLQTIPEDMLEAGRIDGASNLQMFFRLILPLLCPAAGLFYAGGSVFGSAGDQRE